MHLARLIRVEQWWAVKLSPLVAIFCATLFRAGEPLLANALSLAGLLVGIAACAAYVSLSNDLADRQADRLAGKTDRIAGLSVVFIALGLAIPIVIGATVAWSWRDDPLLVLGYAGAWLSFTAYSLPPLRLKSRGLAGVLADATGAHCLPSIVAVLAADRACHLPVDLGWCMTVAVWSGAYGLRGILSHQLLDIHADRVSATPTFVQVRGARFTRGIVRRLTFPVELLAFGMILLMVPGRASFAAMAIYGLFVIGKIGLFEMKAVLVVPSGRYLLFLVDYYTVFWPIAVLLASATTHPADLILLAAQLSLFHRGFAAVAADALRLMPRVRI